MLQIVPQPPITIGGKVFEDCTHISINGVPVKRELIEALTGKNPDPERQSDEERLAWRAANDFKAQLDVAEARLRAVRLALATPPPTGTKDAA